MSSIEILRPLLERNREKLGKKLNVVGTSIALKEGTHIPVITVLVTSKYSKSELPKSQVLPDFLEEEEVNVIEVGTIKALARTDRVRPIPAGVSIGHPFITAGTLGIWLKKGETTVALSNNHVVAAENAARMGDPILQPGKYDGGGAGDKFGTLMDFEPIHFPENASCNWSSAAVTLLNFVAKALGRRSRFSYKTASGVNYIDAGLVLPDPGMADGKTIVEAPYPTDIDLDPQLGQAVLKSGRTTGLTYGQIIGLHATVSVQYGGGKLAIFEDQLIAGPMSAGGDSGSVFLSQEGKLLGLLFAGSDAVTIFSPIGYVLKKWSDLSVL